MGRSNGYRPTKDNKEEITWLRGKLADLDESDWVIAQRYMDRITQLLGHKYGPMGGKIEPRACRYCHYYGHTRQWCKKRKADEAAAEKRYIEAMLKEDKQLMERLDNIETHTPYVATETAQARTFDALGMPYTIAPYCGPVVGAPGEIHSGKWTFDADGGVINRVIHLVHK